MAIEDEIINIADIDPGSEILKDDKLLIETNNGTKLVAFKDFVIGEDNISFADRLLSRAITDADSTASFDNVLGLNILNKNTTPGHLTTYTDVSGIAELAKHNQLVGAVFESLSAQYNNYKSSIDSLLSKYSEIQQKVAGQITLTDTTPSTNFEYSLKENIFSQQKDFVFIDQPISQPASTNMVVNNGAPNTNGNSINMLITYPNDSTFTERNILFEISAGMEHSSNTPPPGRAFQLYHNDVYYDSYVPRVSPHHIQMQKILSIKPGDKIWVKAGHKARDAGPNPSDSGWKGTRIKIKAVEL